MSWETELTAGRGVMVDRTSPIPIYFQVATQLQKLIESDVIPVGTRFENEVDLAERLGVSRPTMRRAMQYLVERGMVVRKRGVGTQVVHPKGAAHDRTLQPVRRSGQVGASAVDRGAQLRIGPDPSAWPPWELGHRRGGRRQPRRAGLPTPTASHSPS